MDVMEFREKLRKAMKSQRYSQQAIADLVDISQSMVSGWLRGVYAPDIYQAKRLADALGCSLDYLLDDAQGYPPPPVNQAEARAVELVRSHGLTTDEVIQLLTRRKVPTFAVGEQIIVRDDPGSELPPKDGKRNRRRS